MSSPILITGAGRRVGNYLANQLKEVGYEVIAHYRTHSVAIDDLDKIGIECFRGDFANPEEVVAMCGEIKARYSSLRAIIHNASAYAPTAGRMEDAIVQYQTFFAVHMMAPYIINESLHPLLAGSEMEAADIIHITDIYAERPNPDYDIYCSTKAGLANLNKSFAKRYAPRIQVNAIAPGPILFLDEHDEVYRQMVLEKTLLQCEGGIEAIYQVVVSLLNNHYMTGTTVPVDGGRSLAE